MISPTSIVQLRLNILSIHFYLVFAGSSPAALPASSTPNEPNAFLSTNLTAHPWHFWRPTPRIIPAVFEDCRAAAEGIQTLRPASRPYRTGEPIIFGTEDIPGNDFLIPMAIIARTCKVRLMPLSTGPHFSDSFTPRQLAHAVGRMNQKCIMPAPHLGGEGGIGTRGVIALVVAGMIKPHQTRLIDQLIVEQGATLEAEYDILTTNSTIHPNLGES